MGTCCSRVNDPPVHNRQDEVYRVSGEQRNSDDQDKVQNMAEGATTGEASGATGGLAEVFGKFGEFAISAYEHWTKE